MDCEFKDIKKGILLLDFFFQNFFRILGKNVETGTLESTIYILSMEKQSKHFKNEILRSQHSKMPMDESALCAMCTSPTSVPMLHFSDQRFSGSPLAQKLI